MCVSVQQGCTHFKWAQYMNSIFCKMNLYKAEIRPAPGVSWSTCIPKILRLNVPQTHLLAGHEWPFSVLVFNNIYIYIYIYVISYNIICIYNYIYIYVERERDVCLQLQDAFSIDSSVSILSARHGLIHREGSTHGSHLSTPCRVQQRHWPWSIGPNLDLMEYLEKSKT